MLEILQDNFETLLPGCVGSLDIISEIFKSNIRSFWSPPHPFCLSSRTFIVTNETEMNAAGKGSGGGTNRVLFSR